MNDKEFTDELFKRMYDLGFRKAEIEHDVLFFFNGGRECLTPFLPRVKVASTCFEKKDQVIDIAEYLGIVDWSKVEVDTPVLVRDSETSKWKNRYFAFFENGRVHTWNSGTTSWTSEGYEMSWQYAKLAKV